jgi:4-hydroxyphenylpyruvate dioxygenase
MPDPDDLVLCAGTLLQASFREKVEAAAAGGFRAITLWPHDYRRAREAGLGDAELRRILADHGVAVADLDPLLTWLPSEREAAARSIAGAASEEEFYRIADALGARSLNICQGFGTSVDLDAAAEALRGVCERAAAHGLLVTLEFLPWSGIPDAATALEIVRRADHPAATVMVDTWHHFRGSCDMAQLRAIPAAKVGSVQINDAPARPGADLVQESLEERLLPGEGEMPLLEMLAILDEIGARAPIGVEVFSKALDALPPIEVGRRAGAAARRVLAKRPG